jgi:parvulin-like peptidyl-prolyl isomerase
MKRWLLPVMLAVLTAGVYVKRDSLRSFLLGNEPLVPAEAVREEQARLRFRGLAEGDAQARVLEAARIRERRLADVAFQVDVSVALGREMQAWRRQWEKEDERAQRLAGQGLTEAEMDRQVREALLDEAWLERQMAATTRVSEAELQAAYVARREALRLPQVQRVAHLFLAQSGPQAKDREPEVRQLHQRLLAGGDWAALVLAHSEDARTKRQAGDLGWVGAARAPEAFVKSAQGLKPGQMSAPVKTMLGWHVIRVLKRQETRLTTLAEVREELAAQLQDEKRQAALEQLTRE